MRKAVVVVALVLAFATPAAAQSDRSPYKVDAWSELTATVGLGISSVLLPKLFLESDLDAPPCGDCDPFELNRFDRPVTTYYSPAAQHTSDVTVSLLVLSPYLLSGLEGFDGEWAKDAVVYTEALGVTLVLTQVVKYAVRRPRPFTYNPDAPGENKLKYDSTLSFMSGHSAISFTMATAAAYTWQLRHPHGNSKYVVWGGLMSLAATTASLRVIGGKHFFTDVLVGSAVGFVIGLVVPSLHEIRPGKSRSTVAGRGAILSPMGFGFAW
jgi:membrane-associated phospholipid phosphatase